MLCVYEKTYSNDSLNNIKSLANLASFSPSPKDTWILPSAQGNTCAQHMGAGPPDRACLPRSAASCRTEAPPGTAAGSPGAQGQTGHSARLSERATEARERLPTPHRLRRSPGRSGVLLQSSDTAGRASNTGLRPLWLQGPPRCLPTKQSWTHTPDVPRRAEGHYQPKAFCRPGRAGPERSGRELQSGDRRRPTHPRERPPCARAFSPPARDLESAPLVTLFLLPPLALLQ